MDALTQFMETTGVDGTLTEAPVASAMGLTTNKETSFQVFSGNKEAEMVIPSQGNLSVCSLFVLDGSVSLSVNDKSIRLLTTGQHMMFRVPAPSEVRLVPASTVHYHVVAFHFDDNFLRKLCPESCPNLCRLAISERAGTLQLLGCKEPFSTRAELRSLIAQISDAVMPSHLQPVYRDIKIAELTILQLEEILYGVKESREAGLRDYELRRVYQVRDILRSYPEKSYTLLGLAHEVGTNDATLKKHFKQVLGCTVFAYLTSCRMDVAKSLLRDRRKSIAEIAQNLGYKHVSHFSSAFRKYYGCSPSQFFAVD